MKENDKIFRDAKMNRKAALCLLSLDSGASLKDVKQAYRRRAKQSHPDKGGKHESFVRIKEAYDYLCKFGTGSKQQDVKIGHTKMAANSWMRVNVYSGMYGVRGNATDTNVVINIVNVVA